jgi:putative ABC transport system permease protein
MRWAPGWLAGLRERVTGLLYREREEAELEEELRFHLEMEADRLVREEGLEAGEARRRAAVSFGGVERTKEEVRDARGLGWLTGWWLDVKLGLRMLVKYPGLTVLGSLSIAFAIFTGAAAFEVVSQMLAPTLPLPDGDRVVAVQLWDAASGGAEQRTLHDLDVWRSELDAVRDLGAFRTLQRNLIGSDGIAEPLVVAAMDPAGFRVAGVRPQLGRTLTDDDARPDAPAVVVIGHDVWVDRFAGDASVIGGDVLLGNEPATVVGVMPEGFGFPVSHDLWVPLDADARAYQPLEGPAVTVFGRLAPGATFADARSQLDVVAGRMAAAHPSHEHLRPQVVPWARVWLGSAVGGANPGSLSWMILTAAGVISNVPLIIFLVLVCGNVALLMFARATSREGELVVRSALGASRSRIVFQLFVEALVLASIGAIAGLVAARYALEWMFRIVGTVFLEGGSLPFWFHATLSPATLFYAALLTVLAAAIAGIVPGLRVTRELRPLLQQASAGGGGFRFGGLWTVVLVVQLAVTVVFPIFTLAVRSESQQELDDDFAAPAEQYFTAQLRLEPPVVGLAADSTDAWLHEHYAPMADRMADRLRSEPRVRGVTFTERLPREYHRWRQVEVDGPTAEPRDERGHRLGSSRVAVDYFDVMGARITAGRGFTLSDVGSGQRVVVVNESFVDRVMGGRNPIGQRVRYLATEEYRNPEQEPGPWHTIIGVVEDLGTISGYGPTGMYHPVAAGDIHPARVLLHVSGDPRSFEPAFRRIAMDVAPDLIVRDVMMLDEVTRGSREFFAFWSTILTGVSGLALLLSLGGIFAVMSFTVARRTREIGIRVALGASRIRVVTTVFRRPLTQIVLGLALGAVLLFSLFFGMGEARTQLGHVALLVLYVAAMTAVCLLACIGPTRRALGVEPAEALRVDG